MPKSSNTIDGIKEKWETIKEKSVEFAHQVKEKSADVAHNLDSSPTTRNFWRYLKANKMEAILGAFMILGLLFSFYWLGSTIVGLATGLYARIGIKGLWERAVAFSEERGKFPTFVVVIAAVFMLFHVFAFVVGLLIGLLIKSIMLNEFSSQSPTDSSSDSRKK